MIVYRVDRHSELAPNKIINLSKNIELGNVFSVYNNSFSQHGIEYLNRYDDSTVWELCLEFIRLNYFPVLPSRLQSIFGTKTLEQAIAWKNYFFPDSNVNTNTINIFEIECENAFEFDAGWFTYPPTPQDTYQFNVPSLARMLDISYNYWSQQKSPQPFLELIIPLPAKVINVVKL